MMTTPALSTVQTAPEPRLRAALLVKREPGTTGTSRYAAELVRHLPACGVELRLGELNGPPGPALLHSALRQARLDARAFFGAYPLGARLPAADVYHLTVQTLGILLRLGRLPRPTVVTVHDIIPYLVRHDPQLCSYRHPIHRWFDQLAMAGLRQADTLIAVSEWTKATLAMELRIPTERITVVHNAADTSRFRPLPVTEEFRQRYHVDAARRWVLYVGSEDPRKNLDTLLRAVAIVHREQPEVHLAKVGAPHHARVRRRLRALAAELGIERAVHWVGPVPEADLPMFYNAADVFVVPSLYEGFGLPVLEALACGTPVVCSNAASLPEVAGDGALLVEATNPESVADGIRRQLRSADAVRLARASGLMEPPKLTGWSDTARRTAEVYYRVAGLPAPAVGAP